MSFILDDADDDPLPMLPSRAQPAVAAGGPALDPEFAALSLADKLERNAHDAMNYTHARLKTADPNDPDTQRLKATDSIAQNTVLHKIRVDEPSVRVRSEDRQFEVRRKVHLESIRMCTERGLYRSGALERYEELAALGMPDAMALVHAEFSAAAAPAMLAPSPPPAIELEAVKAHDQPAAITSTVEPASPALAEPAEAAPIVRPAARPHGHDAPEPPTKAASDKWMNAPFDRPEPKSYAPGRYRR